MVSVSGGGASYSQSETLEEKKRREELEASQESNKTQEQKTATDTQRAESSTQKSQEETAKARTSLPGTTGTARSTATRAITPPQEANPTSQEPKKPSIQLFDTLPTDPARSATQQHQIEKKANDLLANITEKIKNTDDRHSQAAYQEIRNYAEKLIKDGKENEAIEVLKQVIDKPVTLRSLASEIMAQRLSPQVINFRSLENLAFGGSETLAEMQATQHAQMTKEEHQDQTLELMNGLMEDLDESTQTFIRNEEILNALRNPKKQEPREILNPFSSSTQRTNNPFELKSELPSSSESTRFSEDAFSMSERLGQRPNPELIQQEIEHREALRETLIQQREVLLKAQANLTKLAQAGRADQIHLLFDGKGNPLDTETLKDRGSYNSGLPNELENQYRELNDFLKKDPSLEESFAAMQESLIGLSPEEQTVRARDFLTENLQTQRETLRLLQGINPDLNSVINNKNSSAMESLLAIDQKTISELTQETLSRRTDLMLELHDQLTENLNSRNFQDGLSAIEKTQKDLDDGTYTYRNNKLSDYELVNRDLTRTPKEDEEIQHRIEALEKKFENLTDDQLQIVKGNSHNIADHLQEIKSLNEPVPLGLFQGNGWRVVGGEADIRLESIESLQNHSDRVLNNLLSQKKNIKDAHEHMKKSQELERYERRLEEIISQTSSNYQSAGAKAFRDGENQRRSLDSLDNFYGNTEAGLKFTRNAAIIAGVTLATGGAGTGLVAANWGATSAGLAAFGAGSAYGAGVSLLSNSAEGLSKHGNGFSNPYGNVLSQTWQDTKMSASVAAATATGASLTRALSETYKWGRLASSITGAGASGIVSTNITYGLDAAEQRLTTGEVNINGKQYLKDLLWNTGSSMVGGAIGGKFGQWQDSASNATTRFGLIATEELASISADLGLSFAKDGKITTEGLLQTFQASITGRMQAHFAAQNTIEPVVEPVVEGRMQAHFAAQNTSRPKNELAQQIRDQETVVKSSDELPDGVEAQTKVRVEPDGSRKVEIIAKEDLMTRAIQGDVEAQKKMLEETVAHARENPIDPLVKQADGSYRAMSIDQYHTLRARQELAMRSVAEAKFAVAQGSSVSTTKQDSSVVLAEMDTAIKNGDFARALKIAEANGIGETYRKQFDADYEYNSKRNRETDALVQTSFSKQNKDPVTNIIDQSRSEYDPKARISDPQIEKIKEEIKVAQDEIDNLESAIDIETRNLINELEQKKTLETASAKDLQDLKDYRSLAELDKIEDLKNKQNELRRQIATEQVFRSVERKINQANYAGLIGIAHRYPDLKKRINGLLLAQPSNTLQNIRQGIAFELLKADIRKSFSSSHPSSKNNYSDDQIRSMINELDSLGLISRIDLFSSTSSQINSLFADQRLSHEEISKMRDLSGKNLTQSQSTRAGEISGRLHEFRTLVALNNLITNGKIKSFTISQNTALNTSPRFLMGLDALGVDFIIQLNDGKYMVAQAKSSLMKVQDSYQKLAPYRTSEGKLVTQKRSFINSFIADQSLLWLENHFQYFRPDLVVNSSNIDSLNRSNPRASTVIDPSLLPGFNYRNSEFTLPTNFMKILERIILDL
jgi:hypothetical protein